MTSVADLEEYSTCVVRYRETETKVTYRPEGITPATESWWREQQRKNERSLGALLAEYLPESLVVDWTLVENDGSPVELAPQRLMTLPTKFLIAVYDAINDDLRPPPEADASSEPG